MRHLALYRFLIKLLPSPKTQWRAIKQSVSSEKAEKYRKILRKHHATGGALVLFDAQGITSHFVYGEARPGEAVKQDTAFRLASVSKMVTASGILKMSELGMLNLDEDVDSVLPFSLRHPSAPQTPINLRMLLSHTSGIKDGQDYLKGIHNQALASQLLSGDSHTQHLPGQGCEYSNFGLGLTACVIEGKTGQSFELAMQSVLFEPQGLLASFYPHRVTAPLADARRILPKSKRPNFDGAARQASLTPGWDKPDMQSHYHLAQGACCMDAISLVKLAQSLMAPGFFANDTLLNMRNEHASLISRDPNLRQGLGLFILKDDTISPDTFYGHQGMAYGAVNMLFFEPKSQQGIISLTVGASEAREHILTDLNRALLMEWAKHE